MNKKVGYIVAILFLIISAAINSETQAAGTEYLFEGTELPANLSYPANATYTVRFIQEIVQNNNNSTITLPDLNDKQVVLIFEKNISGTKNLIINFSRSINNGNGINTIIFKGDVNINVIIGADSLNGDFGKRNSCSINLEVYGNILKDLSLTTTGHDGSLGTSGGNGGDIKSFFHKNILGDITLQSFAGIRKPFLNDPIDGHGGRITAFIKGKLGDSTNIVQRSHLRDRSYSGYPISTYCTYAVDLSKISQDTNSSKTLQSSGFSSTNPEQNIVQTQQFSSSAYRDASDGFSGVPDFYVDKTKTISLDTNFTYTYSPGITPLTFTDGLFGAITLIPDLQIAKYKISSPDGIYTYEEEAAYNLPLPGITKSLPVSELYKKLNKPDVNFVNCEAQYNVTIIDAFTGKTYDYIWARNIINVIQEIPEVSLLVLDKNAGVNGDYIPPYGTGKKYINMDPAIKVTFPGFAINDYSKTYIINHIKLFIEYQKTATETVKIESLTPEFDDANALMCQIPTSLMNDELKTGKPFSIQVEYYNPFSGLYTGTSAKSVLLVLDVNIPGIQIVKNSNFDAVNFKIIDSGFADTMERIDANGTVTTNYTVTDGMIRNAYFIAVLSDQEGLTSDVLTTDFIAKNCEVYIDDKVFEGIITVSPIAGYVSTVQKAIWRISLQYDGAVINYFDDRKIKIQVKNIRDITNNSAGIGESIVFTPATQFKVDTDPASTLLAEELTISELSYMQDTEDYYRMSMYLDLDTIRCTTYDITLMLNGVEQTLADFVQGISGNGFTASDKLRLINLPVSSGTVSIRYITKSKNGFATVGDALVISESAIVQYLGKVIDLAPDFSAQKDIYLNWPKSPLYASKSIYIPKDCTLHIQGYTRLVFTLPIANEGLLIEQNKKIIVDGTLIIDGQPESGTGKYPYISGVAMSGNTNAPAYFGGIYIQRGGNLFLNAVAISYASAALFFDHTESMQLVMGISADAFKKAYAGTNTGTSHVCIGSISLGQSKIALFFYSRTGGSIYEQIVRAALTGWFEGSIPAIELKDKDSIAESKILIRLSDTLVSWYETIKQQVYYRYITMFK